MGNYATTAELTARFLNSTEAAFLTDVEESTTPDAAVQAEVINDSEGLIDSYLSTRYAVPVDVSGDTVLAARLKGVTLDLAGHRLLVRQDLESDAKQRANDEAIDWLKGIAEGLVNLPSAATLPSTESENPQIAFGTAGTSDSSNRLFTRATQGGL